MNEKRCVIVSGGDFSPVFGLCQEDFVIACDRGYSYCERLGIRPDLVISDFDSYHGSIDPQIPLNAFAPEKDDTDTMLAIRYAADHGFQEVLLFCALGGRLDHTIANLQSLIFARKHGLRASLYDESTEIHVLENDVVCIPRRLGWFLSVFAPDGPCKGVCLLGTKYPLQDAELLPSLPIGVSNEWAEDTAVISVREGILMIILSKMPARHPGKQLTPA